MNRNLVGSIYGSIWPNSFRGKESKKSANQKQESPVAAMFITDRDRMSNLYRGPSIDASYQASDHLGPDLLTSMAATGDLFLIG
jgi:hypothetical protein